MLLFEIKDTGIGIRKEDLGRLFNDFFQAYAQDNRNIVGTGLGLTISKAFVEMMGGNISLDSEYGQGTVFTVTIPLVEGSEDGVVRGPADEQAEALVVNGANILVVDDNELNLSVARGLLHLSEIDAQTALSGEEAIMLVRQNDYDIVFMDHMMPGMDGVETTVEIRKMGGKFETLPIIALTANAIHGAREMYLANGFNGFISKPISTSELNEILKTWLPPDKIELKAKSERPADSRESGGILDALDGIDEIDKEIGLGRFSGEEEIYHETLLNFIKYLGMQHEKMSASLNSGDINGFAASAHLIKSMLSTVGAMTLSEAAFELEMAGKSGDAEYCRNNYPRFLEKLMTLHTRLSAALQRV
jgi:CheY-like chemotaxis protein